MYIFFTALNFFVAGGLTANMMNDHIKKVPFNWISFIIAILNIIVGIMSMTFNFTRVL